MVIIYKITNLINGKVYIGSTNNINNRFSNHKIKLNKSIHCNEHLQNAWDKYGSDSFEFKTLMVCSDNERNHCEQMFMDLYDAQNRDFGYNIRDADAHSVSEETKTKMSENHWDNSGENNPMYGKTGENSPMYGQHHTEKTKRKISKKNAKYTLWDVIKCHFFKNNMFRNGKEGMTPCCCFGVKYNGKDLPIGYNLDFYTPELINDLINEFLEVD